MNARNIGYWTSTALVAFSFLSGGVLYLLGVEAPVKGVMELGYPAYFVTFLGFWKLAGGLAILLPRLPRVKEWAYAGIAFDLIGAAYSLVAAGHGAGSTIAPLVVLGIAAASWALRPAGRRLESAAAA